MRSSVFDGPDNRNNRILELRRNGLSVKGALQIENTIFPPELDRAPMVIVWSLASIAVVVIAVGFWLL